MATHTSRLGLVKPSTGDDADISQLNANFDTLDRSPGTFICTSTSRPSSPFTGQRIYETNTKKEYIWDGSAWKTAAIEPPDVDVPTANEIRNYALDVSNSGGMILGSMPASGTKPLKIVGGSAVVTTNAAGDAVLTHNRGFTSIITLVAWSGDYTNSAIVTRNAGVGTALANQFGMRIYNANGTARASGPARVDYLIVGF